jgi:hypothetical protein
MSCAMVPILVGDGRYRDPVGGGGGSEVFLLAIQKRRPTCDVDTWPTKGKRRWMGGRTGVDQYVQGASPSMEQRAGGGRGCVGGGYSNRVLV